MCNTPNLSFNDLTYVAFSDLCGFKQMMKDRQKAYERFNKLFNSTYELLRDNTNVKALAVSDCVISWASDRQLQSIINFTGSLHKKMIEAHFLMKTTIAYGQFEFQERIKLANLDKQMIWGGAYLTAYLGNNSIYPGSIVYLKHLSDPDQGTTCINWQWEKRKRKNVTLCEYFWAANSFDDTHRIKQSKKDQNKHKQYELIKDLYFSLVSSVPNILTNPSLPTAAGQ